jgi:rubrerythrin
MRDALQRALDFAVAKETEAEAFYKEWARRVSDPSVKGFFAELGAVEYGHREMLRHLTPAEILGSPGEPPGDSGLSEFLVEVAAKASLDLQEAMVLAMKREAVSVALYERLAEFPGVTQSLFRALATEERRHRQALEEEYERHFLAED